MRAMKKKHFHIPAFESINALVMVLICLICIIPFWIILTSSFSSNTILQKEGVSLLFKGFNFEGYAFLFSMSDVFLHSIWISFIVSLSAALIAVFCATSAAYVLSKKYLKGRKILNVFFVITMFFSGGTIPTYLVIRGIGIYDSIWALILPGALSTYAILLMRNFFYGIPKELEEAAVVDGANDFQILVRIYLPLAVPMMLTVGIMTFVGKWNEWLPSLLYVASGNKSLWSAQYVLRQILTDMQSLYGSSVGGTISDAPLIQAKNAAIVIIVFPLVAMTPLLHKYYVKGLTDGSVKG